ncbi:MAG: type II toxin-antitoxin system VapC family toxin [Cytophagales bacterium]|jgi:tRNA(fMet)-specific endonuclease VapC|nr:type II toxin-antitoxin system VapC family toxin [Cytophagales bacterium]
MALLYDTNALLLIVRDRTGTVRRILNPHSDDESICEVTVAEIKSIALRNAWGAKNNAALDAALSRLYILDISDENIINRYVEIDAFSQLKHPSLKGSFATPRNMGKNDLWIAATASFHQLRLVTTDKDFDHLDNVFVDVSWHAAETLVVPKKP